MELKFVQYKILNKSPRVVNELRMHLGNVHLTQNRFYSRKIYVTYKRHQKKAVYIELR